MSVHRLDRVEARRIAIRAQLLDAHRPSDLLTVVDQLTVLQLDPTAAVAPSADLVAWTRLSDFYRPADLTAALERDRTLYEVRAIIRPTADLGLQLEEMAAWPFADEGQRQWSVSGPRAARWLEANDAFRRDVLKLLRRSGPLLSRDIPHTSVMSWESTGWTGNRNVTQMLEFLCARGEVAITRRRGRQRLWDIAYSLEMYKPKEKRRWGYFALPVLHHDQLVGKVDAIVDRKASVLRVHAIHEDVRFTRAVTKAMHAELEAPRGLARPGAVYRRDLRA